MYCRTQTRTSDVHALSDFGTGKGVPLQSLLDPAAENRNRARPLPHRTANQNLVPEPAHEMEKREQSQTRLGMSGRAFSRTRSSNAPVNHQHQHQHTQHLRCPMTFLGIQYIQLWF